MKQSVLLFYSLFISLVNFGQLTIMPSTYTQFNPGISFFTADGGSISIEKEKDPVSGRNWNKYRDRISLVRYDKNRQVQKINKLAEGKNVYSAFYSDLKKIGNKFWFIYIDPAEKNDIGSVKAVEVNPVTLETGAPKMVASSESINSSLKLMGGMTALHIVSESSPAQKYTYLFIGTGKNDFFLSCLDESLNPVWAKKQSIKDVDDYKIKSIGIDDEGVIYLAYVNNKKPYVSVYSKNSTGKEYTFSLGQSTPKDIYLLVSSKTKSVIAAGAYFDGSEYCAGIYKTTIDRENFTWGELIKTPFTASLLEQFSKDGFASTKEKKFGMAPMSFGKLYELADGSSGYVAEMRKLIVTERSAITHAASLLVVNFGPTSAFMARVPKYNLHAGGDFDDQYYAAVCGSNLQLFYRDDPSNLERDLTFDAKTTKAAKNTVLVVATIERDGTIKRKQIGNGENVAVGIRQELQNECIGLRPVVLTRR
jgi:hypothetical protein